MLRFATRKIVGATLVLVAGCTQVQPPPYPLDRTGAALESRSLAADDLRRFLAQNLGRDPSAPLPAQWDFETLAWVAFFYNPSLEVARAQWATAQAGIRTATAKPNPTLSVTPGFNFSARGGVSPWFPAVTFDWLFEQREKRELRAAGARLAAESARQAMFAAAWQVRGELRKALLDLTAAERRRSGLQAQVDVQQRIVTLLDQRRQAGAVGAHEVAVARVALVRAEAAAADAGRQLPPIRQRVAQTLGIPAAALDGVSLAPPVMPGPLGADQLGTARRLALQSRGDVLAALARFEAAQSALDLAVAKQRPDFHLGPGYQWDQGENKWSLALTLELPLLNQNQGPIAEAGGRRREAAAQFLAVQARALGEIESAIAVQQVAAAQIDQFSRIQTALAQQAAVVTARLRAGGADQLESETARLERTVAELALLDAQAQAAAAAGQLEDALQVPFPNLTALAQPERRPSTTTSP